MNSVMLIIPVPVMSTRRRPILSEIGPMINASIPNGMAYAVMRLPCSVFEILSESAIFGRIGEITIIWLLIEKTINHSAAKTKCEA